MGSEFLEAGSILKLNREIFLLKYGLELSAFEVLNNKAKSIQKLLASERDDNGDSQVGLLPLLLIIERQAHNAFECLTKYQSYQAWMVFRPAIEATLIIGKFLDDPHNAKLWQNKKVYYENNDKENKKEYRKQFEGDGLIPDSLLYGMEIRKLLSRINDDFMHINYQYYNSMCELQPLDDEKSYLKLHYCDNDEIIHRAYVYSFLNIYQIMIVSLGKALFAYYAEHDFLNSFEKPSVKQKWHERVQEMVSEREVVNEIMNGYGLWELN